MGFGEFLGKMVGGFLSDGLTSLSRKQDAIEHYEKALAISQEIRDGMEEAADLDIARRNVFGKIAKAIPYYEETLAISQELRNRKEEGNQLVYLGDAYFYSSKILGIWEDKGDQLIRRAIEYYEQAWIIGEKLNNPKIVDYCKEKIISIREMGYQLIQLGDGYNQQKRSDMAIEYYKQALIIGKKVNDQKMVDYCEKALNY